MSDESFKKLVFVGASCLVLGAAGAVLAMRAKKPGASPFASINRPTAGPREEKDLPVGKHPIQLYSMATPNGQKVTILLEELKLNYDAYLINIAKGEQFWSGFYKVNPNSKIPALIDQEGPGGKPVRLFESGSILLYFAEKTGKFIPKDPALRAETINWLFFQMGSAPFFGQFGHFYHYAPKNNIKIPYAIERYTMETKRLVHVLDLHLADKKYLVGDEYTIADIAWWPWIRGLETGYNAKEYLELDSYKNVKRWFDLISHRPAVQQGIKINSPSEGGIKEYHSSL